MCVASRSKYDTRELPEVSIAYSAFVTLQVRCEFRPGESLCQRCLAGNHECVARGRKKRKAVL